MKLPQVSLYLDVRKLVAQGRGYQLKLRVKQPGVKQPDYFELDGHIYKAEEYRKLTENKRLNKDEYERALEIKDIETRAGNILKDLGRRYTKTAFESRLYGTDVSDSSIDSCFARYIQGQEDLERKLSVATIEMYNEARDYLKTFHKRKLNLEDVDAPFLRRWQKWMEENGISKTSIRMYSDRLRAVFNYEKDEGRIDPSLYPFGKTKSKYRAPKTVKRKVAPSLPTIARIMEQPPNIGRDFWLLTYLMNGMNMADMLRIKEKHFVSDKELKFIRQKTRSTSEEEVVITVAMLPLTWELINRWTTRKLDPEAYLFEVLEPGINEAEERRRIKNFSRKVNQHFQKMLTGMGLPKFNTLQARHSFVKVLDKAAVPTSDIQKSLGHTDIRTTEGYKDSIDFDESIDRQEAITVKLIPGAN